MAGLNGSNERLTMLLSSYLDGGLSHNELDEVVSSLEHDEDVVAQFRELKEVRSALRALPMLDLPLFLVPGEHPIEQLSAYLDGELITEELPILSTHLDTCVECRRELAELDRARTAVRALPGVEPPSFLDLHRPKVEDQKRSKRAVIAVMAGVAAVTVAFVVAPFSSSQEPTAVSISDLQARHAAVSSVPSSGTAVQISNAP